MEKKLGEVVDLVSRKQTDLSSQPDRPSELTIGTDSTSREQMAMMLVDCFQTLKLYGKEPETIQSIIRLHSLVLADYPIETVRAAMMAHLRVSPEMPTPADIVKQIEAAKPKVGDDWTRGMRNFTQERFDSE